MKKRPLIGIDASRAGRAKRTGVEWYVFWLLSELLPILSVEADVRLYFDTKQIPDDCLFFGRYAELRQLLIPGNRLWTQVRLAYELRRHPVDLLFVPGHVPPSFLNVPFAITLHDHAAVHFPKSYSWFERFYNAHAVSLSARRARLVFTPTDFVRSELEDYVAGKGLPSFGSRAVVTPLALSQDYFNCTPLTEEKLASFHLDIPFVMSIGRLEYKKNTAGLIRAYNRARAIYKTPFRLLCVGKPGHGYEEVEKERLNSPYRDDILFLGYVGQADLPGLLATAETLVFPSFYEGFGIPLLEAFATGTDVVAARIGALLEIGGDLPLYANTEEEFALAIIHSLTTKERHTPEARIERQEAARYFSWRRTAEITAQSLLGAL